MKANKPIFRCKYCNRVMELAWDGKIKIENAGDFSSVFYRCPKCGATGPAVNNSDVSVLEAVGEKDRFDRCVERLDWIMSGRSFVLPSLTRHLENQLQLLSGQYSALKSSSLPYAEQCVSKTKDEFRQACTRKPELTYHAWVADLAKKADAVDRALTYRNRYWYKLREIRASMKEVRKKLSEVRSKTDAKTVWVLTQEAK